MKAIGSDPDQAKLKTATVGSGEWAVSFADASGVAWRNRPADGFADSQAEEHRHEEQRETAASVFQKLR